MSIAADSPEHIAAWLRQHFLGQAFGCVRFWRFSLVRPNDQFFVIAQASAVDDRLDLQLRHADSQGDAGVLSVWRPSELAPHSHGVTLTRAARLRWGDSEAWEVDDRQYRIRTPRGEGGFALDGAPALTLES